MFLMRKYKKNPVLFLFMINSYATRKKNIRIYLLIDEYDNFTNTILSTYGMNFIESKTCMAKVLFRGFNVIKSATTGTELLLNGCLLPE